MAREEHTKVNPEPTWMRWLQVGLIIIGLLALSLAQSTIWINNTIFNQASFTEKTTTVLLSQESRDSIASAVVDRAFEGRPVADRLLGDRATSFVSNLLGSDISTAVLERVSAKTYSYLTTPDREDIAIDLSAIRDPLSGIISFVENQGREVAFDPESIPSEIVLVESDELPNLAPYVKLSAVLAGLLWLITLGAFAGYIFSSRQRRLHRLYVTLWAVIGVSAIGLASGPFVPPAISSFVANIQLRSVVGDLTLAYLQPFWQQLFITIGIAVAGLLVVRFRWVFSRGWNALLQAVHNKDTKKS